MENKYLLSTCITLLYLRSKMANKSTSGVGLVSQILELLKLPEISTGIVDHDRETLTCLTKTIRRMLEDEDSIEKLSLIQQITLDCGHDQSLLESMRCIIDADLSEAEVAAATVSYERQLTKHIRTDAATNLLYDMARRLKFQSDSIDDTQKYLVEVIGALEPYSASGGKEDPAVLADFNLSDSAAVEQVYEDALNSDEGKGSFVFGFKTINRFFNGSLPAGKFLLIGACQHQHKTGFTLALFRHAAMYNTPYLTEDEVGKKPLLLRISAEDEMSDNLRKVFSDTYFNVEGTPPNFKDHSSEFMRSYVYEKWSATGWEIRFMRINPSGWSYRHIEQKIIELEAAGYVVKLCMLDYLMMIPTTGCEQGAAGNDKRDLVRRVRNFCSARGIVFITPWQLSPAATQLRREGLDDIVRDVVDKSMYSGSTQINQEVDAEIIIHIVSVNGVKYLSCGRGKFRSASTVVDDKYLFTYLPFHPIGGLQDDLNGKTLGVSRPGGSYNDEGKEEAPLWGDF